MLLTTIGTGGLLCWLGYIALLLTKITDFTPGQVPYLLAIAGRLAIEAKTSLTLPPLA